jgi:hypothetical protein
MQDRSISHKQLQILRKHGKVKYFGTELKHKTVIEEKISNITNVIKA